MATDGMWTLTDDGEFVQAEEYATQLQEARTVATNAWASAMLEYLSERTVYTPDELAGELVRRCDEEGMQASEIVDEFVLEALSGDLLSAG